MDNKENGSEFYEIIEKEESYKIVFKIAFIIIVLGLCFFTIYKFIIINPVVIFKSGINKSYKLIDTLNKKINYFNEPITINGVLTADSNKESLYGIDKYKFNLDFNIDTNNNKYGLIIDFNYNNESKAKALFQLEDYNYYLTLPNIYNKSIELNELDYKNIKISKLKDIFNAIKDNINNQIKKEYLKQNKEDIFINDIKNSYDYVELTLTKEELSKVISNVITNIKDDHKLFNDIVNNLDFKDTELNNLLEDIQKTVITKDFNNLKIRYYTNGYFANIVGMKIIIDDDELISIFNDNNLNCTINYHEYKITIHDNDNKYYINVLKDNNNYLYAIINNLKDNLIDIDYEYYNNKGIIHLDINDNHGNFKFSKVNDRTSSINYDFEIIKGEEVNNINKESIIELKKLDEEDYLNIYNYVKNSFDDDYIGNTLIYMVEQLLNY